MKIHKTQDLTLQNRKYDSTNKMSNPYLNKPDYLMCSPDLTMLAPMNANNISFQAKKPDSKNIKKIIESAKKVVGNISKKASPEIEKGDKLLDSPLFNKILNVNFDELKKRAIFKKELKWLKRN